MARPREVTTRNGFQYFLLRELSLLDFQLRVIAENNPHLAIVPPLSYFLAAMTSSCTLRVPTA